MAKKSKVAEAAVPAPDNSDWEAKHHASTIMEAHEIMSDPKKMAAVKKHFKKQKRSFKSMQDVINYKNEKYGPKGAQEPDHDDGE